MQEAPALHGELQAALARAGFSSPADAERHLQAVALGNEGTARVLNACADAADPDLALAAVCRWIAVTGRVPSSAFLGRLAAVLGVSSSLGGFVARHPDAAEVLRDGRSVARPRTKRAMLQAAFAALGDSGAASTALQRWKRRELLRIACRDLTSGPPVEEIALELSHLAEAASEMTLAALLEESPAPPGAGFCVIGMGKLGGEELNYASDIDVMFVYDAAPGDDVAATWATRVAQRWVHRLGAATEDGQAFRVDTTLRPEGRNGPLVRSIDSYRAYYERWAKPWEFQALLKARPLGGDAELSTRFTDMVEEFVFSDRLGPAAIREIRGLKARAERAIAARGIAAREVKRGPGGIRDIEFAVQLLQLVHARRDAALRGGNTLAALKGLAHGAYVGDEDAEELADAYRFLRKVEHRLQLAQERQTHTVPTDDRARRTLARSMGFADDPTHAAEEAFDTEWRRTQAVVRRLHEKLFYRPLLERFAQAPALAPDAAQERLAALGFRSPGRALKFLGDLTAGVSRRAQLMRTLLPVMLDWMSEAPDPDLGISSFRDVALRIGSNPAALAALRDSPPVVELLCRVLGTSRLLAEHLLHEPEMVSALADERTLARRSREEMRALALEHVEWRGDPDARNAALRRLKRREILRIACRDLAGMAPVEEIGRELTHLGGGALVAAVASLHEEYPPPGDARFCVIGMGKLGGEELNYPSDLDVLFVFDATEQAAATPWATRIAEGLLDRLAATTEEGQAFRVDAALRPEGKNGPLVRSLGAYKAYYERWAKPWEFQALVKARPVAGDLDLGARFCETVWLSVFPPALDPAAVREIRGLKARIEKERLGPRASPSTQLKAGTGGLIDIEFTVQLVQLQHGYSHAKLRSQNTLAAIAAAADAKCLDLEKARWLGEAYRFLNQVRNTLYLVRGRPIDVLPAQHEDLAVLARALGYPSPGARVAFLEDYRRHTRRVRRVTEDVFYGGETPAGR
jgi:[glutamine synthetase] adenylyltransferase / [glutamine synthetase]-adenylyl-L-tyrosine phosphorylase